MFQEAIRKAGLNTRKLSQQTKIPYSTLNDIVNDKVMIENVKFGYVMKIASALDISLDEIAENKNPSPSIDIDVEITVKKKHYYLMAYGEAFELCKVTKLSSEYIDDIAKWKLEEITEEKELDAWQEKVTF